ncbi:MAG: PIG-L family deacetylase [Fimbriimonadaceae bacterium]|uniref:N-acetylglucosaminyl deacetylase, LmbE family n=1 Tax=Candidatus Nitrosymbiomonas proteolyticus TaxID=2608984 RepID=A0A809SFD3_9BACT|nr:PIG-L family deacetylase [Fimbriimonadaceae bacterium]NUM38452.1 PIG-L family deacetylase [Armatimonadota bacterium]BBO24724.1 N-acetylglucosaminyl deacetylase, LmbE family [Candidatus Nitrosymbiomonas proteolyticus]
MNSASPHVDVLAIGAHMGDEVAWGMSLAAHVRQGRRVGLLHLTPGEKGHPSKSPSEYADQKRDEAQQCATALGARLWALDFKDGELPVGDDVQLAMARVIREARPQLILTHWRGSMHKDHTAAADNLPNARFYAGIATFELGGPAHWVPRAYHGENWEDLRGFEPEVYLEVLREDIERWEEAMRCYELFRGGVSKFEYLEYYKALARSRGCEARWEFAVTFAVPQEERRRLVTTLLPEPSR